MEENQKMLDVPICDQEAFVLFSNSGGPQVKVAPSISCKSVLHIDDAVYNDGIVRISVVDNNHFGFELLAQNQNSSGSFAVTASSSGDDANNLEAATVTFTFSVVVFGSDHPYLTKHFFAYDYLATVDELISPITVAAYKDCAIVNGGGNINDNFGIFSGLSADGVFVDTRQVRVRVSGRAAVPGVYCFAMELTSHNENPQGMFPEGVAYEYVIICIRKPQYCAGDLVLLVDGVNYAPREQRLDVIHHNAGQPVVAQYLSGEFVDLERTVAVDDYTYHYYFELIDNVWHLLGRYYLTGETPGDYYELATAPAKTFAGITVMIPPENGWSRGPLGDVLIIAGDTRYFVPGFGFFDLAGEHVDYGMFYQQQTLWTAQWPGWTLPEEFQNNQGYILYQASDQWRLTLDGEIDLELDAIVKPQAINGAVIPYAPDRKGDLALENFNVNKYSDIRLICDQYALGIWYQYIYHRQIPPPNGVDTAPQISCKISATRKVTNSTQAKNASSQGAGPPLEWFERYDCYNGASQSESRITSANATVAANYAINNDGLIDVVFGNTGNVDLTFDYSKVNSYFGDVGGCRMHDIAEGFTPRPYGYGTVTETQSISAAGNRGADFSCFIGSGPNPKSNFQDFFTGTVANITASAATSGTKVTDEWAGPEYHTNYTVAVTGNANIAAKICSGFGDFCGGKITDLAVASYKKESVTANCVITENHTRTVYLNTDGGYITEVIVSRAIIASHGRTKITKAGDDIIDGETIVTRDGVTTTYDDPSGVIYSGILAEADSIADFSSVDLNESRHYSFTQNWDETIEQLGDAN